MLEGGLEHAPAFRLVGRRHHHHVRNGASEAEVETAGMGRSVGTDLSGAIDGKGDVEVLQRDVVDQLVVGALKEGGVDGDHRFQAFASHAGGKRQRMLLGDADIRVSIREPLGEIHQAGALAHGRCNGPEPSVGFGGIADPVAEHPGVGNAPASRGQFARQGIEGTDAVECHRLAFRRLVATTLLGHHVEQARPAHALEVTEVVQQQRQVVAVHRPDVAETEFLPEGSGKHHAFHVLFPAIGEIADSGCPPQGGAPRVPEPVVEPAGEHPGEVVAHRAHGGRDGHVVVVEDHQQIQVLERSRMVQGLEGHTARQGAIADHRHAVPLHALAACRKGHAQGSADGSTGMTGAEGVVLGFLAPRKPGYAALLTQGLHGIPPTREYLVGVRLVPHVPDQPVIRRVVDVMERDGEFHHPQSRGQMPTGAGHRIDEECPQFPRYCRQVCSIELAKVGRRVDLRQQQRAAMGGSLVRHGETVESEFHKFTRTPAPTDDCRR